MTYVHDHNLNFGIFTYLYLKMTEVATFCAFPVTFQKISLWIAPIPGLQHSAESKTEYVILDNCYVL